MGININIFILTDKVKTPRGNNLALLLRLTDPYKYVQLSLVIT